MWKEGHNVKTGLVTPSCHPSTQQAEVGGGQPGLHHESYLRKEREGRGWGRGLVSRCPCRNVHAFVCTSHIARPAHWASHAECGMQVLMLQRVSPWALQESAFNLVLSA